MQTDPEREWLRQAVERYSGPLVRYVAVITGDLDHARDVVQDVFVRLCQDPPANVQNHLAEWLFTVCRHRALDLMRKENRMQSMEDTPHRYDLARDPSPATVAEQRDLHRQVLHILSRLPRNQQEVVRLKFQNGLSYEEIARITQLTVTNVGFLLHTALKTLRKHMQAETGTGALNLEKNI